MPKNPNHPDILARETAPLDEGERIRRWRRGMQAAADLQRSLRAAEGPRLAQAVAECLSVLNALEAMGRWPAPLDPVSEQQVQEVRGRWARIQRRARAQTALHRRCKDLEIAIARAIAQFQAEVQRLVRTGLREELVRLRTTDAAPEVSANPGSRRPSRAAGTLRPAATARLNAGTFTGET
jgi:hypothetical protein